MHGCMHDHACMKACMNLCMYVWMHVDKPHHLAIYSIFSLCGAAPPDFCRQERQKGVFTCCWRISWQETKTQLGPRTRGQNWEYDTSFHVIYPSSWQSFENTRQKNSGSFKLIFQIHTWIVCTYVYIYIYIYYTLYTVSYHMLIYIYTQYIDMIYI